jgi:hypothetical protein
MSLKILDMIQTLNLTVIDAERKIRKNFKAMDGAIVGLPRPFGERPTNPPFKIFIRSDVRLAHYRLFLPQLGHFHSGGFPSD